MSNICLHGSFLPCIILQLNHLTYKWQICKHKDGQKRSLSISQYFRYIWRCVFFIQKHFRRLFSLQSDASMNCSRCFFIEIAEVKSAFKKLTSVCTVYNVLHSGAVFWVTIIPKSTKTSGWKIRKSLKITTNLKCNGKLFCTASISCKGFAYFFLKREDENTVLSTEISNAMITS